MMVVGGVKTDGTLWDRSCVDVQRSPQLIELYAPSFGIIVPALDGG